METGLSLRIILESPTAGVDFGLQKGKGSVYETIQKQRSTGKDLVFDFTVKLKMANDNMIVLGGPFVQGNTADRFVYIDIGAYAGQKDTQWARRLKIPLKSITTPLVLQSLGDPNRVIETAVPGTGKDGGPNCATVKPFGGWKVKP